MKNEPPTNRACNLGPPETPVFLRKGRFFSPRSHLGSHLQYSKVGVLQNAKIEIFHTIVFSTGLGVGQTRFLNTGQGGGHTRFLKTGQGGGHSRFFVLSR